jgi:hypothetical protein
MLLGVSSKKCIGLTNNLLDNAAHQTLSFRYACRSGPNRSATHPVSLPDPFRRCPQKEFP